MKNTWHLQWFAQPVNHTGSESLTSEMKTFYDKTLLEYAAPNLVHEQFGQKRPIPAHGGKSIEFRRFAALPKITTPISEGVTPEGQALSVTPITAEVDQYGGWVPLTDVLELTAIDNNVVAATKNLSAQAGLTLDSVVRDAISGGTNVLYCPKLGADGAETAVSNRAGIDKTCLLTVKALFRAAAVLKSQNAPTIDGSYVAIVHPYVAYDLMQEAGDMWMSVNRYKNPEKIYKGEIGTIGGVRVVESTNAKIIGITSEGSEENKNTVPVFATLVFGADAYGVVDVEGGGMELIVKPKGYGDDPLNQRSSVGWKALETATILNDQYLVRVESCSTFADQAQAN